MGKYMSDAILIQNDLKRGDALFPMLFSFASQYTARKAEENKEELELNRTHQLLVYVEEAKI
jgi:hypothetical protein